ncbi:hypothetical protein ACQY0O_005100 [Thecaphora frezii]
MGRPSACASTCTTHKHKSLLLAFISGFSLAHTHPHNLAPTSTAHTYTRTRTKLSATSRHPQPRPRYQAVIGLPRVFTTRTRRLGRSWTNLRGPTSSPSTLPRLVSSRPAARSAHPQKASMAHTQPVDDVDMADDPSIKRKGRGFNPTNDAPAPDGVKSGGFELLDSSKDSEDRAARSVEGWIVVVTNVHEEASEEEVIDKFSDFGMVQNCHLNLDRRTGYVKGYALIEFETHDEAKAAIDACAQGLTLLDQALKADFAFVRPPAGGMGIRGAGRRAAAGNHNASRNRSRSPARR